MLVFSAEEKLTPNPLWECSKFKNETSMDILLLQLLSYIWFVREQILQRIVVLGFFPSSQRDYIKPMLSVLGFPSGKNLIPISVCHSIT